MVLTWGHKNSSFTESTHENHAKYPALFMRTTTAELKGMLPIG